MKKQFKKIISSVLVAAMVVTMAGLNPVEAQAKAKVMTGKKITITVGKKDYIATKPKAKSFKSSNKKIATVSKSGTVKAKAPGKCTITASTSKGKAKVTVTVLPSKATIKSATAASLTSVKVTWKKVTKASGYYVYYSTNKSSGFKKKTVSGGKKTSTTIGGLTSGATYYFKVKAYAKSKKKTYTSAKYSSVLSTKLWKMVFSDEFNGTTLDTTKWGYQTGGGGFGNNEFQEYTNGTNMEIKNGNFIIEPEFKYNTTTKQPVEKSYTSTKIWTKGKKSYKYGKFEFRVKLPKGQGTWAAAWMLGDNLGWPDCGEIDVLETTKELTKTNIPQSIHCRSFNGMEGNKPNKHYDTIVPTATSAYHTYGIEWNASTVKFFIDGKQTGEYNPDNYSSGDGHASNNLWPFKQNFYMILNCAIGGVLGGDTVTPLYWTKVATSGNIETYRDYYYIDYVRVYQ